MGSGRGDRLGGVSTADPWIHCPVSVRESIRFEAELSAASKAVILMSMYVCVWVGCGVGRR